MAVFSWSALCCADLFPSVVCRCKPAGFFPLCVLMGSYSSALVPGKLHNSQISRLLLLPGEILTLSNTARSGWLWVASGFVRFLLCLSQKQKSLTRSCQSLRSWMSACPSPQMRGHSLTFRLRQVCTFKHRSWVASMSSPRETVWSVCVPSVLEVNLTAATRKSKTNIFQHQVKMFDIYKLWVWIKVWVNAFTYCKIWLIILWIFKLFKFKLWGKVNIWVRGKKELYGNKLIIKHK